MAVSFNNIPSNLRVPLFYAELDNSQAGAFSRQNKTLLIGQMLSTGTAEAGVPVLLSSQGKSDSLFAPGSMLAEMYKAYRKVDPFGEVWGLPLDEPSAGAAATGSISITGSASEAGTLTAYIGGVKVEVGVSSSDTNVNVADALKDAINAKASLHVTAASVSGTVNLTSKWKGETGNDISIVLNFYGETNNERVPAGLSASVSAMSGGTASPDLAVAVAAMGDEEYDYIAQPYTDASSLDIMAVEMGDDSGRWSYARQIYGHVWSAKRDTVGNLVAFGNTRNDPHMTVVAVEPDIMAPVWVVGSSYAARCAGFLSIDPARPVQTGLLVGIVPARAGKRFTSQERQTLLFSGLATTSVSVNDLRIERSITTYQVNAFGDDDPSYLDVETLATSAYVIRYIRSIITQKYARHKLANDGTRFGAGQAIVTPSVIKSEIIAACRRLETQGILENIDIMKEHLIVERNANDSNRLDVLLPPDYVNQLRVFAMLNQFRLQYQPEEV